MWILWLIMLLQNILTSCMFNLLNNCGNNRYRHWPQSNTTNGNWVATEDHAVIAPLTQTESINFCLNVCWQRSMKSCVPEARTQTCSRSSRCWRLVTSLDYHQEEEYRASRRHPTLFRCSLCTSASSGENDTVLFLCYRRNCIISAYYQQRETHKATLPNVSNKTNKQKLVWFKTFVDIEVMHRFSSL